MKMWGKCIQIANGRIFFYLFIVFSKAATVVHGGSQATDESELKLPSYTTATATPDLSHVCHLQLMATLDPEPDPWPICEARDGTCVLMDTSQIHFR